MTAQSKLYILFKATASRSISFLSFHFSFFGPFKILSPLGPRLFLLTANTHCALLPKSWLQVQLFVWHSFQLETIHKITNVESLFFLALICVCFVFLPGQILQQRILS